MLRAVFVTVLVLGSALARRAEASVGAQSIDDAICEDSRRAGTWNLAWTAVFGVSAVGSAGFAALAPDGWIDADQRASLYVTAAKASVGVLFKLIDPLRLDVEGLCRGPHPESPARRHALLVEIARRERRALIPNILGGLALNTAGLLYMGFGRGAWENGWISFGVGAAVGVASTVTAPLQSWLLRRRLDAPRSALVVPLFGPREVGLALAASW